MSTKKKKTKKPPPTVEATVSVETVLSVAPLDPNIPTKSKHPPHYQLRLEAQAVYLQDMHGCTVDDVYKDPRFKGVVDISTIHTWAKMDKWGEKRKQVYSNVQERLTQEIQSKLTDRIYFEVQGLLEMKEQAKKLMTSTQPTSWEGVASISLKIDKRLHEIHQLTTQGMIDDAGKEIDPAQRQVLKDTKAPTYDRQMLREISLMFTQKKRAELRAKLEAAEKPPEAAPEEKKEAMNEGPAKEDFDLGDVPLPEIQPSTSAGNVQAPVGGHSGSDTGDAD